MLFEEHDSLFHWFDLLQSPVLDHLYISEMGHDTHKSFLICFLFSSFWWIQSSSAYFVDEGFNIGNLPGGVVKEESSVSSDPLASSLLQFFNERSGIDSEPPDVH